MRLLFPAAWKNPFRKLIHVASLLPLLILLLDAYFQRLTANPIQASMQRTGLTAIILLCISLAGTPLAFLLNDPFWRSIRKPFGLYAFLYACIHVLIFIGLDFSFNLQLLLGQLIEKPFIWFGLTGFLILSSLAITSIKSLKKRLGKKWKPLHRLVYALAILILIHDLLSQKANPIQLQGNVLQPLVVGGIILILLILRLPFVKQWISRLEKTIQPD